MRRTIPLAAVLLLAACGQKAELEPLAGHTMPPAALGATAQPDTEKLLALDPLAAPPRSVELRKRSEEREDDPFDLPPE
jgi:hypothetical protein